jgi:hypothetical protein
MNEERIMESPSWNDPRGQVMKTPDAVAEMLRLATGLSCGDIQSRRTKQRTRRARAKKEMNIKSQKAGFGGG